MSDELQGRIAAHRQAKAAWMHAITLSDLVPAERGPDHPALVAACNEASAAEMAAFLHVLSTPVGTLDEVRAIAAHAWETSWQHTCPEDEEIEAFVTTIMGRAA